MSKQLYDEALADMKKLKEVAVKNAELAIIEQVTPHVKRLLDSVILSEDCDDDAEPTKDDEVDCGVLEDEAVEEALSANEKSLSGDHGAAKPHPDIDKNVKELEESIARFNRASPALRRTSVYREKISKMIESVENIYDYTQSLNEGAARTEYETKLEALYKALNSIQETEMKSRKNRINEEDVTVRLTGLPDDIDLDGIGVDLIGGVEDDVEGGSDLPVDADAGAVDDLDVGGDDLAGIDDEDDDLMNLESLQMESFDDVFGFEDPGATGPTGESGEDDGNSAYSDRAGPGGGDDAADESDVPNRDADHPDDRDKSQGTPPEEYHPERRDDRRRDLNTDDTPISHVPPARDEVDQFGEPTGGITGGQTTTGSLGEGLDDDTVVEIDEEMLRNEIRKMREARLADPANKEINRPKYAGPDKKSFESWGGSKQDDGDPIVDIEPLEAEEISETGASAKRNGKYAGLQMKGQKDFGGSKVSEGDPLTDIDPRELENLKEGKVEVIPRDFELAPDADDIIEKELRELEKEKLKEELTLEMRLLARARSRCDALKTEAFKAKKAGKNGDVAKLTEAFRKNAESVNESIKLIKKLKARLETPVAPKGMNENRVPKAETDEAKKLRAQLAETNLFNAKLTFANKLLQNNNLSSKQKASIITKIDEAKTVREAKLLYDGLTKTLQRGAVNEGNTRQVIGSSSRATNPGSTIATTPAPVVNEGYAFDLDRWQVMAGIKK